MFLKIKSYYIILLTTQIEVQGYRRELDMLILCVRSIEITLQLHNV